MAKTALFSTYRQGENRVTASMLAVFERIDAGVLERLLATAAGESSLAFVAFANQIVGKPGSVPDASISASFRYLFEVKTERKAVDPEQLRRHLRNLNGDFRDERLFVVSPDGAAPTVIKELADPRLTWLSFLTISQAIDELLSDPLELVSEQTRFLLRELQALFVQDGLLDPDADVVVVPARYAYGQYLAHSAYICQPGRSFRVGLSRIAFYTDGAIQREIPMILAHRDNVVMSPETVQTLRNASDPGDQSIAQLVERLLTTGMRSEGDQNQIFLLSEPTDERTMILERPVQNTTRSKSGRPVAWTQGQRYTYSTALQTNPATTRDLDQLQG